MSKILEINKNSVTIGTDDNELIVVDIKDLNFNPKIGDEVNVFKNSERILVTKKESDKKVNKFIYLLIIFFLGGLGFHKFYAGKIGLGILYLLFSWTTIPMFIALIEFFIVLFKQADEYGNISI